MPANLGVIPPTIETEILVLTLCPEFYAEDTLILFTGSSCPPAPLSVDFRLPGVSFGPVHFTEYPMKPEYKDYTPEKILELDL
ncbi:hypothetical protein DSO57_1033020 [Entomophthora muscae]|uniref:Uncharacterized protein n=1 Tax=Entomophthora muscae TaxID=34485 RepID=A0ACC2T0Q1_9FUNG|nr:hypothetical protein DSO57_1033020 [Entomophthora muscae]